MTRPRPAFDKRLRETYQQSREIVRQAHRRAEAAARRAQQMREAVEAQRTANKSVSLELAIQESERSARETERFIAVVSHELRQPLNAVLAAFQLFETNATAETSERARQVMHRQLMQMSRLLDDLLDMSRLGMHRLELKMADVDLRAPLEAAIETVAGRAAEMGQSLNIALPPNPLVVHGDAARLQQVFGNLLSNAVRYTPHGGTIAVRIVGGGRRLGRGGNR